MNNKDWKLLKEKDLIQIFDGDASIGTVNIKKHKVIMSLRYLSGPDICDLSEGMGESIDYLDENGNTQSRWMYFEDLIELAIKYHKVSDLLNKILCRSSVKKAIDECVFKQDIPLSEPINYIRLIPVVQRKAIWAINNILGVDGVSISFSRRENKWKLLNRTYEDETYLSQENINSEKNMSSGFYILPFTSEAQGVMHAINDELNSEQIDFQVNKSGDIFDETRSNDILENIIQDIKDSSIIVADISGKNPNVYYELGLAHAWNKNVIIICSNSSYENDYNEKFPFDVSTKMILLYGQTYDETKKIAKEVVRRIKKLLETI